MPKYIVRTEDKFVVYKQYTDGTRFYATPAESFGTLKECADYLGEEFASAVPANNMGGGAIAGDNIGYSKKRGYKFFSDPFRRKKPKAK